MTRTADTRRGEPGWREHRAGRGATDPSRQGRRGRGTGVPEPAGSYSGSQGAAWRGRWLQPGRPRSSRGSSRVNLEKLMSPRSYPRSSNDSKMSVSMRSHSMLLWYSNFRVVRLPSRRQRVHSRMRSFPRNFQVDSWRLSRCTAHVPSVRKQFSPAHCPTSPAENDRECACAL